MRVSGKLQIHWIARDIVGIIRLMGQQNYRFIRGNIVQSGLKIGAPFEHIVHATQPKARAVAFDGNRSIVQDLNSNATKRVCNPVRISQGVVVSHHRPQTVRRLHLPQQLSARFCGRSGLCTVAEVGHGDEISGQHDECRMQVVDDVDRGSQRMDRKIWIVMKITEERDGEAFQPRRPTPERNLFANDAGMVGLD